MVSTTGTLDKHCEDYRKLRMSFWKTLLCAPLLMVLCWVLILVFGPISRFPAVGFACLIVWFGLHLRASIRLTTWPCPVCGKHFSFAWWSTFPSDTCKHCGVKLGSARPCNSSAVCCPQCGSANVRREILRRINIGCLLINALAF